jgi:DNA modification methylase
VSDKKKKGSVQSRIVKVTCVGATEVALDELVVIQGNFKDLTEEAYLALSQSIRQEGVCESFGIWIRPEDGAKCVVSGTQRLRTLKRMRDQEGYQVPLLPASIVEAKSEAEALRKVVALASQAGDVTNDGLYELLHRIGGDAEEILAGFRNPQINVEAFLEGFIRDDLPSAGDGAVPTNIGLTDPDSIPENVKEVRVKRGEIWVLGEHRLMCGDSTSPDDVRALMVGEKAEMLFTDPPYGVNYSGGIQFTKSGVKKENRDRLINDHSAEIYGRVMPVVKEFVDGPCYTWFAFTKGRATIEAIEAIEAIGEVHALIIWHKTNAKYAALNSHYKQRHEPCIYWKPKGSNLRWNGPTNEATIWELKRDPQNIYHPTQKPVELAERAIGNHSVANVLDLFGGSGSTLIACEKTNRKCFMMEIDPHYCQVIIDRWEAFTGKTARPLSKPKLRKKKADNP